MENETRLSLLNKQTGSVIEVSLPADHSVLQAHIDDGPSKALLLIKKNGKKYI